MALKHALDGQVERKLATLESERATELRAEQQALAKWGLNYVIEDYLPRKLKDKKSFLP